MQDATLKYNELHRKLMNKKTLNETTKWNILYIIWRLSNMKMSLTTKSAIPSSSTLVDLSVSLPKPLPTSLQNSYSFTSSSENPLQNRPLISTVKDLHGNSTADFEIPEELLIKDIIFVFQ